MTSNPQHDRPDRNLALELARVTEAAALASARLAGRGDKEAADQAAVDAMRFVLDSVPMNGTVVIGEGEKDEAPMLYNGEQIGDGSPPEVDIAVDPLEGTRLCALGMPSAIAVIALAERGTMFDPGPIVYMEKMAGNDEVADLLDLDRPLAETLRLVAERKGMGVGDVTVVMLDRPRHERAMAEVREAGGRIRLITDGDVSAALLAVSDRSPVDLLYGIGGTPEGVITAAALKCMGGAIVGRLWARDETERRGRDRRRLRPLENPHDERPLLGRRRLLLRHRRDRRRRAAGRPLPRQRRDDRVARDALALGHRAPRAGDARPHEAARDHRRAVRLNCVQVGSSTASR